MLCCAFTNLVCKIKIHTRGEGDNKDGEANIHDDSLTKTDRLTTKMCEYIVGTGATVNMVNYYMSATTAIHLKQRQIYCRGTIRSTRKFLPKSILFTSSEARQLPRGHVRCTVNEENQIVAVG
jgi:hypothetical protein